MPSAFYSICVIKNRDCFTQVTCSYGLLVIVTEQADPTLGFLLGGRVS
jgi:hypothetical protein